MVTKSHKKTNEKEEKKGRVKVGKLQLRRETVKNLTSDKRKQIRGGLRGLTDTCAYCDEPTIEKTCRCTARCQTGLC